MRIGILADIHDAVVPLTRAIALLRDQGADRFVALGDAFDSFRPGDAAPDVARALLNAQATGVWGNHDVGLSDQISDTVRSSADPSLLGFSSRLQPQLVLDGHRFSHVLPFRNPRDLGDLWTWDDLRDSGCVNRCFEATPERILFVGHYHRWSLHRSDGAIAWTGASPIELLRPDRYLVVVGAVCDGWCALYDSDAALLTPIRC